MIYANVNGIDKKIPVQSKYEYEYIPCVRKQGYKEMWYINTPLFLDTETSHNHDDSNPIGWIYQWAFEFNGQVVGGRTPTHLIKVLKYLHNVYKLNEERNILIYIHNASYDLTYLIPYLREVTTDIDILAVASHKIISLKWFGFEFRCSWKMSNMSLAVWGNKVNAPIKKLVGAIDYDVIRYQDSKLTQTDWDYMVNDVLALKSAWLEDIKATGDDITTVPLTSTGYVRRDCRKACRHFKDYDYRKNIFTKTRLTVESYKLVHQAFVGAIAHGNRRYSGKTVTGKIRHRDFKSHYPSRQQLDDRFPDAFILYYDIRNGGSITTDKIKQLCTSKCVIMKVIFENLQLKNGVTCPYISASKIINPLDVELINEKNIKGTDNGRVINAIGKVVLSITEIDFYWICRQYNFKSLTPITIYISNRHSFPEPLKNTINDYFTIKETLPDGIYRMKSKNKLNGIYGMTATDIVRDKYTIDEYYMWSKSAYNDADISELLDEYYKSRNNFLPYQYGLYTTALARHWLMYIIADCIGYDHFLYCDTDSAFYISTPEIEEKIENFNKWVIEENKKRGLGVKNKKGNISYYGTFEDEKENIKEFRFLHSKCYGFTTIEGDYKTVIAGVTADNKHPKDYPDYVTREEELGELDNMADGFIFEKCGGSKSVYTNTPVTVAYINGHRTEYSNACIVTPTTKTLGGTIENFMEWREQENE